MILSWSLRPRKAPGPGAVPQYGEKRLLDLVPLLIIGVNLDLLPRAGDHQCRCRQLSKHEPSCGSSWGSLKVIGKRNPGRSDFRSSAVEEELRPGDLEQAPGEWPCPGQDQLTSICLSTIPRVPECFQARRVHEDKVPNVEDNLRRASVLNLGEELLEGRDGLHVDLAAESDGRYAILRLGPSLELVAHVTPPAGAGAPRQAVDTIALGSALSNQRAWRPALCKLILPNLMQQWSAVPAVSV
jgi:hypothetical protein